MTEPQPRQENPWISLIVNIAIPAVILMKFSTETTLGPVGGLIVALAFPLTWGLVDLVRERRWNFISILGVVSILLTGGIGLLELDPRWVAVKEAAVPGLIGVAVVASLKTRFPVVRSLLYNERIIHVDKVEAALDTRGTRPAFEKSLVTASWLLAASFFVSSVLNFVLARVIVKSPAGTTAFNEELGRMTALSYPVIVIPSMAVMMAALWYLFRSIRRHTELGVEDIFKG
jgi:hypothetical protein